MNKNIYICNMDSMVAYLEGQGFKVTKTYQPKEKRYGFTIGKEDFSIVGFFVYPDKDGITFEQKSNIMKDFCDHLIADFWFYYGDRMAVSSSSCGVYTIEKVIFNGPATIVFWSDGTKTVVKTQNGEAFDPEKGLAMAMAKRAFGNKGNYFNHIRKWVDKYKEEHPVIETEVLYSDGKPVVTLVCEKTYPIKSVENCNECKWGFDNDCSKYSSCKGCPHADENEWCKCHSVHLNEPCPYFEESENKA